MSEMVTGTPSIVGFTDGGGRYREHGWSAKDAAFASNIDAGERTRDVLGAVRFEGEHLRDAIYENGVAIEKNGMAGLITAEKIGAAVNLAIEKTSAANGLAIEKSAAASQLFAAQNHAAALAQAAACCCELKELIRAENGQTRDLINANTVQSLRDALSAAQRFVPLTVPVPF